MFSTHTEQSGNIIGVIFYVELCTIVTQSVIYYYGTVNYASCSLVESFQRFGGTYCLHLQGRIVNMETAGSYETGIGSFPTNYIASRPRKQ
jgi:hypothetical protein